MRVTFFGIRLSGRCGGSMAEKVAVRRIGQKGAREMTKVLVGMFRAQNKVRIIRYSDTSCECRVVQNCQKSFDELGGRAK